jgi:NitT/TauT family transport system substrate-binding protein
MTRKSWGAGFAAAVIAVSLIGFSTAHAAPVSAQLDKVTLQLKGEPQAEFAGYYAAKELGFYKAFGLDVNIKVGAPAITPEQVVASGHANIGVGWPLGLLVTRDTGTNLVDIAQMFARSGMAEIVKKSTGIASIADLSGKTVGVWCCGNQFELYAALAMHGMDPERHKGVTIVNQPFNMNAFLEGKIDAAQALTYDELARVLESKNPRTDKLYTLKELNVFKFQDEGTGMLEDELFARQEWVTGHRDVAMRFVAASDRGWIYCRDHVEQCTSIVLQQGPSRGKGHQTWMMNEVNKLIWPSTDGIGVMDPAAFRQTAAMALKYKAIKKPASAKAYDAKLPAAALRYLVNHVKGVDVYGTSYRPAVVKVTPGGK